MTAPEAAVSTPASIAKRPHKPPTHRDRQETAKDASEPVIKTSKAAVAADAQGREDAVDILDAALSSLFDIPPIAYSAQSPDALYTYTPPEGTGPDIKLRIPDPSADNYTKLQANQLWLSGVFLADQIHLDHIPVKGERMAELGAAAGLPGVSACSKGARVVATDWNDASILSALRDNYTRACGEPDPDEAGSRPWQVRAHRWGTDTRPLTTALRNDEKEERFDSLLLADTLWVTDAHSALLDSIFNLLKPGGTAYIAAGLHTGRGPVERFTAAAENRGGHIENRREVMWRKDGSWDEKVVNTTGLEEERGVVVYFELRVPG